MSKIFGAGLVWLVATIAFGGTLVDQGNAGVQPWAMRCTNCSGAVVQIDGGNILTGYRPEPQTNVYLPAPYRGEAAGNAGRVGHHVATGGVAEAGADAGLLAYLPMPLARHNTTNLDTEFLGTVVGLRVAGAQGNTDLIMPIFIDGTNQTPGHGVVTAGRNYQDDGSGDIDVRIQRMGISGATVIDNHCFTPTNTSELAGVAAAAIPAAALTNRRFAQICNDPRNASTSYIACSETTTATTVITDPNDTIFPGDCITYWVGSSVPIACISNAAATSAQVKQCF